MQKQLTAPGLRDQIMVMAILSLKRKKESERERARERERKEIEKGLLGCRRLMHLKDQIRIDWILIENLEHSTLKRVSMENIQPFLDD